MTTHWHEAHFGSDMNQSALAVEDDSHFHDPFQAPPLMTRIGEEDDVGSQGVIFGSQGVDFGSQGVVFGVDELREAFEAALSDDPNAIGGAVGGAAQGDAGMMEAFEVAVETDPYAIGQNLGL